MIRPFASMKGGDVLAYVRDVVIKIATDKRTYLNQSAAVGGTPLGEAELAEVRALEAAAEAIQFALTAGQEAQTRERPAPEWVVRMAAQVRAALTELIEPEQKT